MTKGDRHRDPVQLFNGDACAGGKMRRCCYSSKPDTLSDSETADARHCGTQFDLEIGALGG